MCNIYYETPCIFVLIGFCEQNRQKCDSGFTINECPNPFASSRGLRGSQLPVGANDHPQSFAAKNGGRAPPSIGPMGRPFAGSIQRNTWQAPGSTMQGGFGLSSAPGSRMTGGSIFGPQSSGMSQFSGGMGGAVGGGMSGGMTSGMGGGFFPDSFGSPRDTTSWQAGPSPQGRFTPAFAGSPGGPGFSRFDGSSGGMSSGFGGGMSSGAGSGPGMFRPPGPPPFWMRSSFRRF